MNTQPTIFISQFAGKQAYTIKGTPMALIPTGAECDNASLLPVEAYVLRNGELKRAKGVDGSYVKKILVECELVES